MAEGRTLLAVFAHPDDESFGCGGTLARYAAAGDRVVLACATRGEAGKIADPSLGTQETLARVREAELRCAAEVLGIAEVIFLGYRDSGMEGTPANHDPASFVNVDPEVVVEQLAGLIRRVRPQIVITFEPNGGYGHPDHVAIHHHTVAAYAAAGDVGRYPEQGPAWHPARLFYTAISKSRARQRREAMAPYVDVTRFVRFEELAWPDEQIHVTLDVSDFVETKWAAVSCHRTQLPLQSPFRKVPEALMKQMMSPETFVLASPPAGPGARLADLFDGL